jgi:hypothetical protein
MLRLTIVCVVVASMAGLFINQALARGRSFPIEVTGTIIHVDRPKAEFTIQIDEPARVLTIGLKQDCKFTNVSAPARIDTFRKGNRVRVRYFATIFTGNLAVEIEMNPRPQLESGVVERIELAERRLIVRLTNSSRHLVLRCATNARFVERGKIISPTKLKEGALVNVSYYSPAFERKYAVEIVLRSQ